MSERLKSLEFQRIFQEYTFLGIDEEYKKEFIKENNSKFNEAVRKILAEEPHLKDIPFTKNEPIVSTEENLEPTEPVDIKGLLNSPELSFYSLEWLLNKGDYGEIIAYSKNSKHNENTEEKNEENKEEKTEVNSENKEKAKYLFRKIAKKTHPDKTKTNQFADLYMKAKNAYDLCDLIELYSICIKLGITYEIKDSEKDEITAKINIKKDEIKKIELSFIWLWTSSFDEEYRKQLLRTFFIQEGYKHGHIFNI